MAKFEFIYGTMGAAKSAALLLRAFNWREKGFKVSILKPDVDTRTEKLSSRVGIEAECHSLEEACRHSVSYFENVDAILVDEIQFAKPESIDYLARLVEVGDIEVAVYGLLLDAAGELFEGSRRVIEVADVLTEMRTPCWCGADAKVSAFVDDEGHVVREHVIGPGKGRYVVLCRKHFREGNIGKDPKFYV